jgi:hypothetical protein
MTDNSDGVVDALRDLEQLLVQHKVPYARVVSELLKSVPGASIREIREAARQMFRGTMGSITDIYITKANGHIVDDEVAANAELGALTTRLWQLSSRASLE